MEEKLSFAVCLVNNVLKPMPSPCKVGDVASIVLDFCSYGTEDRFPEMTPWSSLEVDTSKREALNCYLPGTIEASVFRVFLSACTP